MEDLFKLLEVNVPPKQETRGEKRLNRKCHCGADVPLGSYYNVCQACFDEVVDNPGIHNELE